MDVENMDIECKKFAKDIRGEGHENLRAIYKNCVPKTTNILNTFQTLLQPAFRLAALDKEMRVWDSYVNLDSTVKNMLTSLRAVAELQNPSLRERHWGQLLVATKKGDGTSTAEFVVRGTRG